MCFETNEADYEVFISDRSPCERFCLKTFLAGIEFAEWNSPRITPHRLERVGTIAEISQCISLSHGKTRGHVDQKESLRGRAVDASGYAHHVTLRSNVVADHYSNAVCKSSKCYCRFSIYSQ